jgi:CRP-like cAMP-binding protein
MSASNRWVAGSGSARHTVRAGDAVVRRAAGSHYPAHTADGPDHDAGPVPARLAATSPPSLALVLPRTPRMPPGGHADPLDAFGRNQVLRGLSAEMRARLHGAVERTVLVRGEYLATPGTVPRYAYFPVRGVIALVATTSDGRAAQVGLVGPDGAIGVPGTVPADGLPYALLVPVRGDAVRIRASTLQRILEGTTAGEVLRLDLAHRQMLHLAQAAVCHRFHPVSARLTTWLLQVSAALGLVTLDVTQDQLEQLLGSPRRVISAAATGLQDHGVIHVRHGRVRIVHRTRLMDHACACWTSSGDGHDLTLAR